jgi:predicted solute-binding protein
MLRVGVVDYLNSRPLAWGLLRGPEGRSFEVSLQPPARLADLLASGGLDVGLLPSIELERIPGLVLVGRLGIASTHEVRSVLLVARRPVAEIRRVALDRNSRTSAALTRILFAEKWGVTADYLEMEPDAEAMLAAADAALLIGDPALRIERGRYRVLDLAAEWRGMTGLPFVFAAWAAPREHAGPPLAAALEASLARGEAELDRIVAEAAAELALPPAELREYLTSNLRYRLGERELAGLAEFHRRAREHGLLPAPSPA